MIIKFKKKNNLISLPLSFQTCQVHHSPSMVHLPSMFERKYHTFSRSTTHLYWSMWVGPAGAQPIIIRTPSWPLRLSSHWRGHNLLAPELYKKRSSSCKRWFSHTSIHTRLPVSPNWENWNCTAPCGAHLEGLRPPAEFQPTCLNEGCSVFILV